MDSKTTIPDQQLPSQLLQQIETLYDQALYRQAYDLAAQHFQGVKIWPTAELRLKQGNLLGQLGLTRQADAVVYQLWRKAPNTVGLLPYYINTRCRKHGPLRALLELAEVRTKFSVSPEDEAHLSVEEAKIYLNYRDFSAAELCLSLLSGGLEDRWIAIQRVEVLLAEDRYKEALELVSTINQRYPKYRYGIQREAHLLQLLGEPNQALQRLSDFWAIAESYWLGMQLFDLAVEQKQFSLAESILPRLKILPPLIDQGMERRHRQMQADLLFAQEKYDAALEYLEPSSFYQYRIKESIQSARDNSQRRVLDVPFVRQANMTCAPASLTAISQYWGEQINQQEIIDEICYGGTQSYDERRWAEEQGWFCCEFELRLEPLKALIGMQIPVLLATVEPGSAHLQIIVGYDDSMGTYILRDPYYPRLQEFLVGETEKYYAANGPRCMIMAPQHLAESIKSLNLPARPLYDALYKLNRALKSHSRDAAFKIIDLIQQRAPTHRMTAVCERTLAIYDNDEAGTLAATEKLLSLYPRDVNFQLSKLYSLDMLGSSETALLYLEELAKQENCHFLILSQLASELTNDHRETRRAEKLYRKLLKSNPMHTRTLYGFAGALWDQEQYQLAYQLYRFCACLDDTDERYVSSFFKASRYHKRVDDGLRFLIDRFERFKKQSSGPVISLFNALDSIDRTEEGLEYLQLGLLERNSDGDLMLFVARNYAYIGKVETAMELLDQAKQFTTTVSFNEAAIAIYEARLERDQALDACQAILVVEPLNFRANNAYARLLTETDRRDEAIAHLRQKLEEFPENAMLQRLLVNWLDASDVPALCSAYKDYCKSHPLNTWAKRGLSAQLIKLGEFESALQQAQDAVLINSRDSANFASLGNAYLALSQNEKAHDAFQKAIQCSCDYDYAYGRLLSCSKGIEAQLADLEFIYQQLMAQVSYGDGILEFQSLARDYFEFERIEKFLRHAVSVRPDLWQSWAALSIHLRNANRSEEALECINEAIEKFPLLPRLHLEKAEILRVLHRSEAAIETLEYTLSLSPGWTWAANSLCELYEKQGNIDAAIKLQEKTISRDPLASTPRGFLADLLARKGEKEAAIVSLERAIACNKTYHWAWRKLNQLKKSESQENLVLAQLEQLIAEDPNNGDLVLIHADLSNNGMQSMHLLQTFLRRKPHHIEGVDRLVRIHTLNKQFDEAHQLCGTEYWQGVCPLQIQSREAQIFYAEGNLNAAIRSMEKVAKDNANFYDAWRYLTRWYKEAGNKDGTADAAKECVRLYPHDTSVLCYCAEQLQEIDGDSALIKQYLQHAYELDPADQYIGLTLIDYLLELKDAPAANAALQILLKHQQNPYVYSRALDLAILQEDQDQALTQFRQSVVVLENDESIVYRMWWQLDKAGMADQAKAVIDEALNSKQRVDRHLGRGYGEFQLKTLGVKKFEKQLLNVDFDKHFYHRYLEAYIRYLIKEQRSMSKKLEVALSPKIKEDSLNWGLYAYRLFLTDGGEAKAATYFDGLEKRADVQAWLLYYASMAWRWAGKWHKGIELINQAIDADHDNFRGDIVVWHLFDRLATDQQVDPEYLLHLHNTELEATSKYILSGAKVLAILQDNNLLDRFDEVSRLLRECQRYIQPVFKSPVVGKAKKMIRTRVVASLPQMFWLKHWYWRWKISNHF